MININRKNTIENDNKKYISFLFFNSDNNWFFSRLNLIYFQQILRQEKKENSIRHVCMSNNNLKLLLGSRTHVRGCVFKMIHALISKRRERENERQEGHQ